MYDFIRSLNLKFFFFTNNLSENLFFHEKFYHYKIQKDLTIVFNVKQYFAIFVFFRFVEIASLGVFCNINFTLLDF